MTLRSLKEILPSVPGDIKDSARLNKALASNEDRRTTKDILGLVVDTNKGTLLISLNCKDKILSLLDTPPPPHGAAWK